MKKLIRLKIYFDRARMYMNYVQLFILMVLLVRSFKNTKEWEAIKEYQLLVYPLVFIVFCVVFILVGYLDVKMGVLAEEQRKMNEENPAAVKMLDDLAFIRKKMEEESDLQLQK